MKTTITPKDIQTGDTIVTETGRRIKVTEVVGVIQNTADHDTVHVRVEQPQEWTVTNDRYLTMDEVTVERKPARKVTRTVDGITWISQGDKKWVTEDGAFSIEWDDTFETECDDAHPVKLSQRLRDEIRATPGLFPYEAKMAVEEGRKGYLCPGCEVHHYGLWTGGPESDNDCIARDENLKVVMRNVARFVNTGERFA